MVSAPLSLQLLLLTRGVDHSTAVHVLSHALASNGACTALDGILTAGNLTDTKSALMQPLFKAIGDAGNNVYLDKGTNGEKKNVMQQAFGTGQDRPVSGALSTVKAYFSDDQVKNFAQRLSPKLDRLTGQMINHAAKQADAAINKTMQGSAKTSALSAVDAAKGVSGHLKTRRQKLVLNRISIEIQASYRISQGLVGQAPELCWPSTVKTLICDFMSM